MPTKPMDVVACSVAEDGRALRSSPVPNGINVSVLAASGVLRPTLLVDLVKMVA